MERTPNGENQCSAVSLHAIKNLEKFRRKDQFCDAVIRTSDGEEFRAHRIILATNDYFDHLFPSNDIPQSYFNQATCEEVSRDVLSLILDVLYTGSCEISLSSVDELITAAVKMSIASLVDRCVDFIQCHLNPDNCLGYGRLARNLDCEELISITRRYTLLHFPEVEWSFQFMELNQLELCDLLDDDAVNVKREYMIFSSIVRWISHKTYERKSALCALLQCVRFGLTNYTFISDVWHHPLVVEEPKAHAVLSGPRFLLLDDGTPTLDDADSAMFDHNQKLTRPRQPPDILFSIGGWSGGSPISSIETYDVRTDRWFLALDTDSRPRAYHSLEVVDNIIYMLGGFDGTGHFNTVRCYDPGTRRWSERGCMYTRRCYVSTCVLDGKIYAIGGSDGRQRLKTCERFDPLTNQWQQLADMHASRSDAAAVAAGGRVFVAGGFNGLHVLDSVEVYDPADDTWTFAYAMMSARSGVSLVHLNGVIYALGGFDGERRLSSAEKLVLGSDELWQPIANMTTSRSNFASCVLESELMVMGGFNGSTTIASVERYNPEQDRWTRLTDMHIHRSALSACVVESLPNAREYSYLGHYDPADYEEHESQ